MNGIFPYVPNANRSCQPFGISDNGLQLREALLQNFQTFLFLSSKLYFSLLALVQFAPECQQGLLAGILCPVMRYFHRCASEHLTIPCKQPVNRDTQSRTYRPQGLGVWFPQPQGVVLERSVRYLARFRSLLDRKPLGFQGRSQPNGSFRLCILIC